MKILRRFFFWIIGLLFCLILIGFLVSQQLSARPDFETIQADFAQKGISMTQQQLAVSDGGIHYVRVGDETLPSLLLVHGSPGDWSAWRSLLEESSLVEQYNIIVIDRPPYNGSNGKGGSLVSQSNSLHALILNECNPCIAMGHSYGGALVLQLAVDYPTHFSKIISLAGTIDASNQQPKWYNYMGRNPLIAYFLSTPFKASNTEMMLLPKDLSLLDSRLHRITAEVILLQGGQDVLVAPDSPFSLLTKLDNVTIDYDSERDHFVIWTDIDAVLSSLKID